MQNNLTDKEVMQQALDALTDCMDHTLGMADRANYASRAAISLRGAIAAYGQPGKGMPELPPGVMIGRPHEEVWTRERALAFGRDCFAAKDVEIAALRKDALRAATAAFSLVIIHAPDELPDDALALAAWIEVHGLPLIPDEAGPEGLFIDIIRKAIAQAAQPLKECCNKTVARRCEGCPYIAQAVQA